MLISYIFNDLDPYPNEDVPAGNVVPALADLFDLE